MYLTKCSASKICIIFLRSVKLLTPGVTAWHHIHKATLTETITCCLTTPSHYLNYVDLSSTKPSHYLNQCWVIVNWNLRDKLQWKFNQNTKLFIQENASEKIVCEKAAILSRGGWAKGIQELEPNCQWILSHLYALLPLFATSSFVLGAFESFKLIWNSLHGRFIIWMQFTNIFSTYLLSSVHRYFHWTFIAVLTQSPAVYMCI